MHRDGQLIELDFRKTVIAPTADERQNFFQELRAVAQMRGYRDGWTAHKYKDRFGQFPPWDYKTLRPAAPSELTLRWVLCQLTDSKTWPSQSLPTEQRATHQHR